MASPCLRMKACCLQSAHGCCLDVLTVRAAVQSLDAEFQSLMGELASLQPGESRRARDSGAAPDATQVRPVWPGLCPIQAVKPRTKQTACQAAQDETGTARCSSRN